MFFDSPYFIFYSLYYRKNESKVARYSFINVNYKSMKGKTKTGNPALSSLPKMRLTLKSIAILLVCTLNVQAAVYSQHKKFDIALDNVAIAEVFRYLHKVSEYDFVYDSDALGKMQPVSIQMEDTDIETVLKKVLEGSNFGWSIEDKVIIISKQKVKNSPSAPQSKILKGVVVDEKGTTLPGVTVLIKGTTVGNVTDEKGEFRFEIPDMDNIVLVFSFVGMKSQEVAYRGQAELKIVMEEDVTEMEEVVVTGIFQKAKESYKKADYSDDNWAALVSAYDDAVTAVDGAADAAAAADAQKKGTDAMAAIQTLAQASEASAKEDAKTFVDTYLRDGNGNIWLTANGDNYEKIMSGVTAWNDLTNDGKLAVNAMMTEANGGKKTDYNTLWSLARDVKQETASKTAGSTQTVTSTQKDVRPVAVQTGDTMIDIRIIAGVMAAAVIVMIIAGVLNKGQKNRNK